MEIENLKATQATRVSPQQQVTAISQAMSCLYVGNKKTPVDTKEKGSKQFVRKSRPPKPARWVP